jgi:uncharacterized membrane protein YraQ (UPF0718 family)
LSIAEWIVTMLQSGADSLASYLAAHVLLCLVPAFFIAGAMTALIPKEAITRYLGRDAPRWVSYPMAAVGGFVLAVCSCTILPLFAGIYRQGAGLGPAITFLFVGPAINILAVSYTGVAIGLDIAVARIVLSAVFGIGIGLIMAFLYRRDDARGRSPAPAAGAFAAGGSIPRAALVFLLLLLAGLIVGTLAVGLLTDTYAQFTLPLGDTAQWQATLDWLVPYDAGGRLGAGRAAHRAAGPHRRHGLEGPQHHRRRVYPVVLGRPGAGCHDAVGRRPAFHPGR